MNVLKSFFTVLFLVAMLALTGCSIQREYTSQTHAEVLRCPEGTKPGEKCAIEYRGPTHLMGGGRVTALWESGGQCTYNDKNGKAFLAPCGTKNLAVAVKADRVDTLGGALISGTADVLSARQIRLGNEYAADNTGPGMVIINDNNSGSSSGAMAGTDTDIDINQDSCPGCISPIR